VSHDTFTAASNLDSCAAKSSQTWHCGWGGLSTVNLRHSAPVMQAQCVCWPSFWCSVTVHVHPSRLEPLKH
jgi:hypothetical protein